MFMLFSVADTVVSRKQWQRWACCITTVEMCSSADPQRSEGLAVTSLDF